MKIRLGYFDAKFGRESVFNPTTGNDSLYQDSNDNGVRIVNFDTSKNLVVMSTMFPHRKIYNTPGPLQMGRLIIKLIIN
jgi:hypothetical protein